MCLKSSHYPFFKLPPQKDLWRVLFPTARQFERYNVLHFHDKLRYKYFIKKKLKCSSRERLIFVLGRNHKPNNSLTIGYFIVRTVIESLQGPFFVDSAEKLCKK
jgi:hypothetical protein